MSEIPDNNTQEMSTFAYALLENYEVFGKTEDEYELGTRDKLIQYIGGLESKVAELEEDKERLNSCESALISMVNQFFYSKAGENIFRHSFMSAEEEAAEYLVEHGIARWVGKNKSAICFNEVQE